MKRCLTCYWWDGEEGEMGRCYARLIVPRDPSGSLFAEWPVTSDDDRCPRYRRDIWKTLVAWYWAIRRWWFNRRWRR